MSSALSLNGLDKGILLEAGTNEVEVLVFRLRDQRFGVNVAKVREVLPIEEVTDMPKTHAAVDGLVQIRDVVVPLVNLETYLYGSPADVDEQAVQSLVLLEFNNQQIAFRVRQVDRIFRVSWKDTLPAPQLGEEASPVTSVLRQEEGLVPLLDFESITATIGIGRPNYSLTETSEAAAIQRARCPIVYADDSRMIGEMVKDSLVAAGYTNLKGFVDGQDAWNYLNQLSENTDASQIADQVACIVTDVEMPLMDGLRLTKHVRDNPVLRDVPVIVFSSIASKDNEKKSLQVGVTKQVSKPNYDVLVEAVHDVLSGAAG